MSTGLPAHPAWIIYQLTLGAVYCCALFWRAPTKTEHEIFFLIAFLVIIGVGFWASYRLLTNSIAAIHRRTIWANVWWWLFLFSFPLPLFLIIFYFPGEISPWLPIVGFFSLLAVAILSDKFLPYPKGTIIDDFDSSRSMVVPFSAFRKSGKQDLHHITPDNDNDSVTQQKGRLIKIVGMKLVTGGKYMGHNYQNRGKTDAGGVQGCAYAVQAVSALIEIQFIVQARINEKRAVEESVGMIVHKVTFQKEGAVLRYLHELIPRLLSIY